MQFAKEVYELLLMIMSTDNTGGQCLYAFGIGLQDGLVTSVIELAMHLENANFSQFWATVAATKELVDKVSGFQEAVRTYIQHTITMTYTKVPKSVLGQSLRLDGATLDSYVTGKCSSAGWSVQKNSTGKTWPSSTDCCNLFSF